MSCIVNNCPGINGFGIQTFKFPSMEHLKEMWLQNIKLDPKKKHSGWSRVCSRHFEKNCIQNGRMRYGAMPTLLLGHNDPVLHQSDFGKLSNVRNIQKCLINGCLATNTLTKKEEKIVKSPFICKEHFQKHSLPKVFVCSRTREDQMDIGEQGHSQQLDQQRQHLRQQEFQKNRQKLQQDILNQQLTWAETELQHLNETQDSWDDEQQSQLQRNQQSESIQMTQRQNLNQEELQLKQEQKVIFEEEQESPEDQSLLTPMNQEQPMIHDLTFNEYQQNQEVKPQPNDEQNEEQRIDCQNCKQEKYFRQKYTELLNIFEQTNDQQEKQKSNCTNESTNEKLLRQENSHVQQSGELKLHDPRHEHSENCIPIKGFITEEAAIFASIICNGQRGIYTEKQKILLLNFYYYNREGLTFMRNSLRFPLPENSTICRWNPVKYLQPGRNEVIVMGLKAKTRKMTELEKVAILTFDENTLWPEAEYNIATDQVDGFEDDGRGNRSKILAKKVMIFVLKGAFSEWKFVTSFHFSSSGWNENNLSEIIDENIDVLESQCGFKIICVISNQQNSSAFKHLHNADSDYFYLRRDRKIYTFCDMAHSMKSIRNAHMEKSIDTPQGTASWDVYRETFHIDKKSDMTNRLLPKMSKSHLEPNEFEGGHVFLATEVYSDNMVKAIEFMINNNLYEDPINAANANATKHLTNVISKSFEVVNAKSHNKNDIPVTRNNKQLELMEQYRQEIMEFEIKGQKLSHKNYCDFLEGFPLMAWEQFNKYPTLSRIFPGRFHLNSGENMFPVVRRESGSYTNPSVREFQNRMGTLLSMAVVKKKNQSLTNYENDYAKHLNIDWKPLFASGIIKISDKDDDYNFKVSENTGPSISERIGIKQTLKDHDNCKNCELYMINCSLLTESSNDFIELQQYGNDMKLKNPSDMDFNIFVDHMTITAEIFKDRMETKQLRKQIIEESVRRLTSKYPIFFNTDKCLRHRVTMLEYLTNVLLRKMCRRTAKYKKSLNPI